MIKSIGWDTSFHLNGKFPLLDNSIFPSLNAAKLFVSDPTSSAIAGTIIGVDDPSNSNETGLYEIFNNSGELALRKLVSEETLSGYQTKIDSLVTDLSNNYSSELAELAGQLADLLEALRGEMFSPDNDTTPITRTMMLLVGADSTNYRFSTAASGKNDTDGIVFNSSEKSLTFLKGTLYHFSITDSLGKPRTWSISDSSRIELEGVETPLGKYMRLSDYVGKGKSLWVYLKVPRTGSEGVWLLSPTKYACVLDSTLSPGEGLALGDSAYYYLLYGYCGIIPAGSPFFEPIYGNTWIKGSTIYTGKVQTMDGYSALDLDNNTLKLGNDFYYSDGLVVVGNPDTGAFVFHKHGDDTALHVGTMTKDSNGNESWNGMTFADGELTIGKYDDRLHEMQTQLDKEVSTWYGEGIPLPYKENNESNTVDSVAPELAASYNETLTTDENGVKMFNLSPDPEPLPRHINDIYINSITGVGYRLVVSNWGGENLLVYWLQLSLWDLLNILNLLNGVNTEVGNIKEALNIVTEDGKTVIGDKFIETMMLRIGADSTNYTLTKTSTSGNRMLNLYWSIEGQNVKLNVSEGENLHHSVYYWTDPLDNRTKTYDWAITKPIDSIINVSKTSTIPYYLYIKCSKTSNTAEWLATNTARSLLDSLYYYFPFGTVVDPSTKTLVEVRGNTKIVGDRIITGKLESNTGNSFFDLDNGLFALGVDLSDPGDLNKAAFSFDGSTVHIGSTAMFDTQSKFVDMSDSWTIEGINNLNLILTLPLLHLLNTKSSTLYRVENGLRASIITPTGQIQPDLTAEYIIFLATNKYSIGLNGVETWPSDVSILTPGKIFLGKDGYSIYILWGISSTLYGNGELTLSDLSERYFQDFEHDLFNYSLLIDHIHIKYYDLNELLFPMFSTTEISGGLVLTNVLGVKDSYGNISAGICGINNDSNKTAFWAGADLEEKEDAPVRLTFSGIDSKIGPLKVLSDSIIEVGDTAKKVYIDNTDTACIKILEGNDNLKILASPITTVATASNVSQSWGSGGIKNGTKMGLNNGSNTIITLLLGTVGISKAQNPIGGGTYSHEVTSEAKSGSITLLFNGNVTNSNNYFGLKANINLYIKNSNNTWSKVKTLASHDQPITSYHDKNKGIYRSKDKYAAFLVTFDVQKFTDFLNTTHFNRPFKIALEIIHLSRCWAHTSSSITKVIDGGKVTDASTLKEWTINLISDSEVAINCNYKATINNNTNKPTYATGLISTEGLLFVRGNLMFAVKADSDKLIIVLSGLLSDGNATPIGINSSGNLCIISKS